MEEIDERLGAIIDLLIRHEGLRLKPYTDTVGKLTIGVGRNLEDRGITKQEAMTMLLNDLYTATMDVKRLIDEERWDRLNDNQQAALINMSFNLGLPRLSGFKKMFEAINKGWDPEDVTREMLNSKWADQVGIRATELARLYEGKITA